MISPHIPPALIKWQPLPTFQDQFTSRLEVIISKKKTWKVTVDEEWVSEKEMKDELKWSPPTGYKLMFFSMLKLNCPSHM